MKVTIVCGNDGDGDEDAEQDEAAEKKIISIILPAKRQRYNAA